MITPPGAPRAPVAAPDLLSRIDTGIRERLEEAVDDACLTALVRARESSGRPAPLADAAEDRAEFESLVRDFLRRLQSDMPVATARDRARNATATPVKASAAGEPTESGQPDVRSLLGAQVALAKEIPDYWQRFDTIRAAYVEETVASSRQRPGFLRRILGG